MERMGAGACLLCNGKCTRMMTSVDSVAKKEETPLFISIFLLVDNIHQCTLSPGLFLF